MGRWVHRVAVGLTTAIGIGLFPVPSAAQSSPDAVVRTRNEEVKRVLVASGDSISDEVREYLKDAITGLMDFNELSRRSLRRHWDARTTEEKEQFVEVFRDLVRNSSVQKLEAYETDSITYQPAETDGDLSRVVTTAYEGRKQVEVVYLMHRAGGEWKAFDVIIDGSSTLRTYQDSFQREIRATSYENMYNRMVEKLEKDRAGSAG